jgi:hypothetical protein
VLSYWQFANRGAYNFRVRSLCVPAGPCVLPRDAQTKPAPRGTPTIFNMTHLLNMLKGSGSKRTASEIKAQESGAKAPPIIIGNMEFDPSPEALGPGEMWWRDHYQWLKERGYLLRPRYDPAWVPSWLGTKKIWYKCEDGTVAWVCTHLHSIFQAIHRQCSFLIFLTQLALRTGLMLA